MLTKLRPRSAYDVMAALALFVALSTGGAYAANTIGSSDVIDESLLSQDLKNGEVKATEIANNAVAGAKLAANSVNTAKVVPDTLGAVDLAPGSVGTSEAADNALGGADILESSLAKVPDADTLDGRNSSEFIQGNGRVLANRVVGTAQGTQILNIPYMGVLTIDGCDNVNGRIRFDTVGSGFVYFMVESGGSIVVKGAGSGWTGGTAPSGIYRMQMSRNTGSATQIVDITVSWNAVDCVFAAHAVQHPGL